MHDTGTTAFMMISSMLVLLMTPGLAFFYGGLARRKNVINTMYMVLSAVGVVGVVWVICGWSIAYGGDGSNPFFGGLDQLGLSGLVDSMLKQQDAAGQAADQISGYPDIVNVIFQAAFAMITVAIITGAVAGRMKFRALIAFVTLWVIIVYAPLAHMVWGGEGSFIGDIIGALDFAGGDVVHISSGVTGLLLCIMLGKRRGFGQMNYRAHNVPFVVLGASLLWFGWFGFNAGSAFEANGVAALALLNTVIASASSLFTWLFVDWKVAGKPTLVGAATGLVAGLVVITPAAGFVEPGAALIMGIVVVPCCYFGIAKCKKLLNYDDALDAFGCHGIGGIVGGILTGLFCVPDLSWTEFGGLFYTGDPSLLFAQLIGILVTLVYVVILTLAIAMVVKFACRGLRVTKEEEASGLDISQHGESAYPAYVGLD